MTKFKVPDSAEEAVEQLGALGRRVDTLNRLLAARQWERAAIVASLVGPPVGHGPGRGNKSPVLDTFPHTIKSLSELGIHGLSSRTTITDYRNVWVRERPIPDFGDEVDLDGLPEWTGQPRPRHTGTGLPAAPEPEPEDDGTTFKVDEQLVTRMALRAEPEPEEEVEEPSATVVHMRNYDAANLNIDRALELLKAARRSRDEDYPHLNTYQKYSVRGWITQARALLDELWPVIEEEGDRKEV